MVTLFHDTHKHVNFTKSQIQDKEKELKRDYRMIKDARKQSGVGWSESRCMIEAEAHLWNNLEIVSCFIPLLLLSLVTSSFIFTHLFQSCFV